MTGTAGLRRGSRLTVQGWLYLVLSAMGAVVLTGAVASALLLNRTDNVARELIDEIQPARASAYQLQAALRDQETALRGYVLAADRQFLVPYYDGQRAEFQAAEDIRQRVGDNPQLMADLEQIGQAAAAWRSTYAEPVIASVAPGRPAVVTGGTAERGKADFDRIRELFDRQNDDLVAARSAGLDELRQVQRWRDAVLIAMEVTFLVTAVLLATLVRSAVTRPLAALASVCRRITQGNFGEKITPQGPKDIRAIATDVENMRQRVVDELAASQSARELLAEQAKELDEQAIELRRSNAELEQFAYVASHDLQEPLRKVAAFCQLLERRYGDKLDDRGVEYIGFAVDGAKRMQVLINDLLAFSRVGRLNATQDAVDLDAVLDGAVANLATALDESGARIVRPTTALPTVDGDRTLLGMLWQNLIGNAVKFRRDGAAPRIVIDCEPATDDVDSQWLFSVTDNGIGISAEFADKVFVIFQRLHGRDAYAGTGIGLAICKKIVEYHGGAIWIDTSHTDGTRIKFTLPSSVEETPEVILKGTPQ
jgi:signal transduction histidine kinase